MHNNPNKSEKKMFFRTDKGSRLVRGTRLVVFPRPNHSQFEKATSRDPLPSREPLPLGVRAHGVLRPVRGSRSVGIPRAGSPQRAGTLRIFPKMSPESAPSVSKLLHYSALLFGNSFWLPLVTFARGPLSPKTRFLGMLPIFLSDVLCWCKNHPY